MHHLLELPNYLYLSQKLAEIEDPVKREEFLKAVAHGSAAAWEHVNLLGEYDLSEEKFKDSVGIKPPKLTAVYTVGAAELTESLGPQAIDDIPVGHYVPLLEFNRIRSKTIYPLY